MKKLLALVLALVMTMGLATISSNAAFNDESSIQHKEAVGVMSSLGIIEGKTDGNFDPNGNVTRAEMAKMVAMTMLGSDTDASAFTGAPTDLNDINGHWAEGWIKYCISQGIVAGRGNNTFAPSDNVTSAQAAKMLLVAIGYNSDVQGYVGPQWQVNVARDAQISGFYKQLSNIGANKTLTRDEAAQMIYNAADCKQTMKTEQINKTNGELTTSYVAKAGNTLLEDTFKIHTHGDTDGNWVVTKVEYQKDGINAGKFRTEIRNYDGGYETVVAGTPSRTRTFYADEDTSPLLLQRVVLRWQDKTNSSFVEDYTYNYQKDQVLSVVAKYENAVTDDFGWAQTDRDTDKNLKMDGNIYSLYDGDLVINNVANAGAGVDVYEVETDGTFNRLACTFTGNEAGELRNMLSANGTNKISTIRLVDRDMDSKYETAIITRVTAAKVTYVSGSSFVTNSKTYTDDKAINDGAVKDDFVSVQWSFADGKTKLTKLDRLTGTVSSTSTKLSTPAATIDGTTYLFMNHTNDGENAVDPDNSYEYSVVNGVIVNAKITSAATADNIVFVSGKDTTGLSGDQVKVYYFDGSTRILTVDDNNYTAGTSEFTNVAGIVENQFYRISETSKGYRFYPLENAKYDKTVKSAVLADYYFRYGGTVGKDTDLTVETMSGRDASGNYEPGLSIEDNAVIFVYNRHYGNNVGLSQNTSTAKVITGKQLKTIVASNNSNNGVGTVGVISDSANTVQLFYHKVNGVQKVTYAAVEYIGTGDSAWAGWTGTFTTNAHYAVILGDASNLGNGYYEYKIWNGEEEVTVVDKSSGSTNIKKFDAVSYSYITDDGEIKDANIKHIVGNANRQLTYSGAEEYAVAALSGFNKVSGGYELYFNGNSPKYKTDDDTVWLYIDSDNKTGVTDSVALSTADDNYDTKIPNVLVWTDGTSNPVKMVAIDITNRLTKDASVKVDVNISGAWLVKDADGNVVEDKGSVKQGDILTVTNYLTNTIFRQNCGLNDTNGNSLDNQSSVGYTERTVVVNGSGPVYFD